MEAYEQKQEQEHEVCGAEIPMETEAHKDTSAKANDRAIAATEELENMRKRLKKIEEETGRLRDKFQKELGAAAQGHQTSAGDSVDLAAKAEADSRSIYVGNVDYGCNPEELQQHFQSCGTVNRVTILTDEFSNPKGYAYVEFVETEAVPNALLLHGTELCGRKLKVLPKRTNRPGMKQYQGRFFSGPFTPEPVVYPSYGYRRVPRHGHPMGYKPY